jgi:hypothetical protein
MYDEVYDAMAKAKIAKMLVAPIWVNKSRKR